MRNPTQTCLPAIVLLQKPEAIRLLSGQEICFDLSDARLVLSFVLGYTREAGFRVSVLVSRISNSASLALLGSL